MLRKKREAKTHITPELLKFREKRKWQIALRRYVLERNICFQYAPYFGLDIENMRKWFEMQFKKDTGWQDFAEEWQFDHIIPVTYFDFSIEEDLKLCWNFTNLRVELLQQNKDRGSRLDILAAKGYFEELYKATNYLPCLKMLQKINQIELSELISSERQQQFIQENQTYLAMIENYSNFEFELLNHGRSVEEVNKEIAFFKKFDK
ncbi:MAG: hypothetical protein JST09_21200 [Bacteroidetes bacterium]|nr:hypothetical protein [Bacteroidota bacterium]